MKHGSFPRKLGRDPKHRWAMLRTMVTQLIEHERISTTVAKAKELRKLADQVVTMAKKGTLAARRQAGAIVRTETELQKLFTQFAARYKDRAGGYCRVLQTGQRGGDSASMALIEYVDREGELRPPKPPEGLSVSWAAREFVNKQMEERRTTDKRERTRVHGREEVLAAAEVMSADAAAPPV
uniref:50S ribosomal protein L17 n=1 Tax=Mantoniella antarctica TaxID=81844 RepID=A0A7S0SCZ0_9CHLO|mmetsp:Transcript_18669/g.46401  ORF Transcript_18669/g.46401 Transcript_18669/m.46401 type:complete len:182 (+) Transcript_18669:257-802(+)